MSRPGPKRNSKQPAHWGEVKPQLRRIIELYEAGGTLESIAGEVGGTRANISLLLREVGIDPGARRREAARLKREVSDAKWRLRFEQQDDDLERAFEAVYALEGVCENLGVRPSTVGQWYTRQGVYHVARRPRVDATLPPAWDESNSETRRVRSLVEEACAGFSPRHLWQYYLRPGVGRSDAYQAWLSEREEA